MKICQSFSVEVFLDSRTDADVRSLLTSCTFGTPPLVIAARNGHLDVVRYLIDKKVDIEQTGCVIFDGDTIGENLFQIFSHKNILNFDVIFCLKAKKCVYNDQKFLTFLWLIFHQIFILICQLFV